MSQKLSRTTAAEFSFFLAVPTMFAATCYKLLKIYQSDAGFTSHDIQILVIGNIVAFIVAMLAIKFFISFLTKHGFKIFGYINLDGKEGIATKDKNRNLRVAVYAKKTTA